MLASKDRVFSASKGRRPGNFKQPKLRERFMSKPIESVWVRRIISVVIKNNLLKMTSLDEAVEKDIVEVERKIEAVEKAINDCTDPDEKKQ